MKPALNKRTLRKETLAALRRFGPDRNVKASSRIRDLLAEWEPFRNARTIGVYISLPSEPNLGPLVWSFEKDWSIPHVGDDHLLYFHRIESESDIVVGRIGVSEPDIEKCPPEDNPFDLILVPGVAFDPDSGHRIGRGGGHYDRFLARQRSAHDPMVVGICFSIQLHSLVPDDHDQPVNCLVTEDGFLFPDSEGKS